jgi:hypothetical protein
MSLLGCTHHSSLPRFPNTMEPGSLALTAFFRHPRLASGVRLGPVTARTGSPIGWNAQRTFPEIPFPSTGRSTYRASLLTRTAACLLGRLLNVEAAVSGDVTSNCAS